MENQNERIEIPGKSAKTELDEMTVDLLKNALRNAAIPLRQRTKKQTLAEFASELKKQLARGHTAASMAAVLQANGMQVSATTIGKMLATAKTPKTT